MAELEMHLLLSRVRFLNLAVDFLLWYLIGLFLLFVFFFVAFLGLYEHE